MKRKQSASRTWILAGVFLLLLLGYSLHLMQLQVVHGAEYARRLQEVGTSTQLLKAARGEILDRNGEPLAVNKIGRNVVIDQAYLTPGSTNEVIHKLTRIMREANEGWIDNLPLTKEAPFAFKEGEAYTQAIATLKKTLKLQSYATAEDVVAHLREQYKLEDYSDEDFRTIAGVRYEMTRTGFDTANPYTFATDVSMDAVLMIKERSYQLRGVDVVETTLRQYVGGDLAPHIIGQVGNIYIEQWSQAKKENGQAIINGVPYKMNDVIGKDGAELAFEKYLKGQDGERRLLLSAHGEAPRVEQEIAPVPGNTVMLTIDARLQRVAQDALASKIKAMRSDIINYPPGKGHEADAGAVAVIHIPTGEVLALATYPSYNLQDFQKEYSALVASKPEKLLNRAVLGGYTPGSIFKPAVALAGLSEGVTGHTEHIFCSGRYTRWSGYQPTCLSAHGHIDVVTALRQSCNIYFYEAGYRLGIEKIREYTSQLGMGVPTGIEIPEYVGRVSSQELKEKLHRGDDAKWQPADTVQTAIGQLDTKLSPLQLANYTATLAANGTRMELTLLKAVKSYTLDQTIYEHKPKVAQVMDAPKEAFDTVREGMIAASRVGTARAVFGEGLYEMTVASKTGTPEAGNELNSTFIAYAPAEDPEIAVCVVIEKGYHGYTGAPVAKEIFDAYFYPEKDQTQDQPDADVDGTDVDGTEESSTGAAQPDSTDAAPLA